VIADGAQAVLFDALDEASMVEIGRLIWENRLPRQAYSVSSSGLQYALTAYWRSIGALGPDTRVSRRGDEAERLVVVSGSGSPETAASIRQAVDDGYAGVRLNPDDVVRGEIDPPVAAALEAIQSGRNVVLYTALGPDDAAITRADQDYRQQLGVGLGSILRQTLERSACGVHWSAAATRLRASGGSSESTR
jgi:3-oxoisoapionate kinase